jgi:hypothetical protein
MPNNNLHIGDYNLQAAGNMNVQAQGKFLAISAAGEGGALMMNGASQAGIQSGGAVLALSNQDEEISNAVLTVGELGSVKLGSGVPEIGAQIALEPEAVLISCGPPGVGASIKMTPESITFQVGEVSFTLTPAGIVEEVAECSREHTPQGHNLTAAESEFNLGVQGESKAIPTEESEVEGGTVDNETMGTHTSDAMRNEDAGVTMTV